jgi:hypothetical protein
MINALLINVIGQCSMSDRVREIKKKRENNEILTRKEEATLDILDFLELYDFKAGDEFSLDEPRFIQFIANKGKVV